MKGRAAAFVVGFVGFVVGCFAVGFVGGCFVGCGTVAIQQEPARPRTHRFVDAHGRPRAWGSGVCPVRGAHDHAYPPVPRAAFVDDGGAWRDTRERVGFAGPHVWGTRRCTLSSFHEHVQPTPEAAPNRKQRPAGPL